MLAVITYLGASAIFAFAMYTKPDAKGLRSAMNLYPGWQRAALCLVMWLVALPMYVIGWIKGFVRAWLSK